MFDEWWRTVRDEIVNKCVAIGMFGLKWACEKSWNAALENRWQPIDSAPKDGTLIDIWCIAPDGCDFEPTNGGIRLTDVAWHNADDVDVRCGWMRVLDNCDWDFIEMDPDSELGLPKWKPVS